MKNDTPEIVRKITKTICSDINEHYGEEPDTEFILYFIKISDENFQSFETENVLNLLLGGFANVEKSSDSWCFVHRLTQATKGDPVEYHSYIVTPMYWPSTQTGPFAVQKFYSFVFSSIATTGSGGGSVTRRAFETAFDRFTDKLSVKVLQVERDPFPELYEQGCPLYIRNPDRMVPRYKDPLSY